MCSRGIRVLLIFYSCAKLITTKKLLTKKEANGAFEIERIAAIVRRRAGQMRGECVGDHGGRDGGDRGCRAGRCLAAGIGGLAQSARPALLVVVGALHVLIYCVSLVIEDQEVLEVAKTARAILTRRRARVVLDVRRRKYLLIAVGAHLLLPSV